MTGARGGVVDGPGRSALPGGGRSVLALVLALQVVDSVDVAVFAVFSADIRDDLQVSEAAVATVASLAGVMVALASLPLGLLADRRPRTLIAGVLTVAWAAAAALLGAVQSLWQLVAVRAVAGLGKAGEGPVQTTMLVDAHPPAVRGRVLGVQRAGQPFGAAVGPALAAVVAASVPAGESAWRWAFAILAVIGAVLAVCALRLPDPGRGRFDGTSPLVAPVPVRVAWRRLYAVRSLRAVLAGLGALGLCLAAIPSYLGFVLADDLGQDAAARGVITAVCACGGLVGAVVAGAVGDRLFRHSPPLTLRVAGTALALLGVGFAVQAYAPTVTVFVVTGVLTQALTFAGVVLVTMVVSAVTPPELRSTAFAAVGVYLAVVGGLLGALITGMAADMWGTRPAIAVVAAPASVLAGAVLAAGAAHLRRDVAAVAALRGRTSSDTR